MTSPEPVFVGDEVSSYAETTEVGTTSITVKIESRVRRGIGDEAAKVTEAYLLFAPVAIDANVDQHHTA